MASSIQLLRSNNAQERPFPGNLLDGQPAINTNAQEPGLFFKASDGSIVKIGPAAITSDGSPPNTGGLGQLGNAVGELWLDKSVSPPILKIYDGSQWVDAGSGGGGGGGGQVTLLRWAILATAGQTVLSGADSSSQQLTYTAGFEEVYVNGAFLRRGIDYTATNNSTITVSVPLALNDEVTVMAWTPFEIGSQIVDANVASNAGIAASKLSFAQPGTGGVIRTVEEKLKDVISIADFGAIPDCTGAGIGTDVIPAILAAVNYAVSLGSGTRVVLPPGRYRASTSAVLDLGGNSFIELDFQGVITPDSTAMTVLTIVNGIFIKLKASVLEGGIFNGYLAPQPYGPCDYFIERDAAAAGGQEMFLIRGVGNYTVDLCARGYAGRLLRTDERTSTSHPRTIAIKGQIKTERPVNDLSKARTAQSLWADGGTTESNAGNWGSLDRLVCDFDAWGPVWNRLNDIDLSTLDCAFGFAGPTFRGCIVVTGNTWYVGDTDGGGGSRHVQFVSAGGIDCAVIIVKSLKFLNRGPGLHMENVFYARVSVEHLGLNIGDVATLINCRYTEIDVGASTSTGSSLCKISGPSTEQVTATCRSNGSIFSSDIVDIAADVTGVVTLKPSLTNRTAGRAAIKIRGNAQVRIEGPELAGTTGSIFDITSALNSVSIYDGVVKPDLVTVYTNGISALRVIGTSGLEQSNGFNLRSNVGGNSTGEGGALDLGIGVGGFQSYSPIAKVKGQLINSVGTELQGDLALQIRPLGAAGQSLIDAITASNTSTDGEMTAVVLARIGGNFVSKRVKFGNSGSGPGGVGRALYIDD
jgi:hypothetical protein